MHQEVEVAPSIEEVVVEVVVEAPKINAKTTKLSLNILKCKECFHALDFDFAPNKVEYFCSDTCSTLYLHREEINKIRKNNVFNVII